MTEGSSPCYPLILQGRPGDPAGTLPGRLRWSWGVDPAPHFRPPLRLPSPLPPSGGEVLASCPDPPEAAAANPPAKHRATARIHRAKIRSVLQAASQAAHPAHTFCAPSDLLAPQANVRTSGHAPDIPDMAAAADNPLGIRGFPYLSDPFGRVSQPDRDPRRLGEQQQWQQTPYTARARP